MGSLGNAPVSHTYGRDKSKLLYALGLDGMLESARKFSGGLPFVRGDLFGHLGRVRFSERTFHPVSGMLPVEPKIADPEIGHFLDLSRVEVRQ